MSDAPRSWLIAYDIACPRRLARVHRLVSASALPVQFSVYIGRFNTRQMMELEAELSQLIDDDDDVRFYALGEQPWYRHLGDEQTLPDAIWLLDTEMALVDHTPLDPPQ